jgi:hypothetical protein
MGVMGVTGWPAVVVGSGVVMGSDGWQWNGGWVTFGYVGDERRRRKTIRCRGKWGREREK